MNKQILKSKKFVKNLRRRFRGQEKFLEKIFERLVLFEKDRNNKILRDHQLIGRKNALRAFSCGGDIRIIYRENDIEIVLLDVGSHAQVYDV